MMDNFEYRKQPVARSYTHTNTHTCYVRNLLCYVVHRHRPHNNVTKCMSTIP